MCHSLSLYMRVVYYAYLLLLYIYYDCALASNASAMLLAFVFPKMKVQCFVYVFISHRSVNEVYDWASYCLWKRIHSGCVLNKLVFTIGILVIMITYSAHSHSRLYMCNVQHMCTTTRAISTKWMNIAFQNIKWSVNNINGYYSYAHSSTHSLIHADAI